MNEFARITSFVRSMAKEDAGALGELYRDAVKRGSGDPARGKRIIKDTVTIEKAEACSGDRNSRRLFFYLHDRISVRGCADHNAGIERGTDCGSKNKYQTAWKRDADSGDLWRCGRDVEGASR